MELRLTLALWLVADLEALSYQATQNLNKSENLETCTAQQQLTIARVSGWHSSLSNVCCLTKSRKFTTQTTK